MDSGKFEIIKNDLLGKSTSKRRKAAIVLRKESLRGVCNFLVEGYKLETTEQWKTRVEIIKALSYNGCMNGISLLKSVIFDNTSDYSIIKKEAAKAWVRLTRKKLNDSDSIIQLLGIKDFVIVEAALEVLGYDKMIPDEVSQEIILKECWDFGFDRPEGVVDPRYGLAAACAGWTSDIAKDFLSHCLKSDDVPLVYVAKKSLTGKYVKLR